MTLGWALAPLAAYAHAPLLLSRAMGGRLHRRDTPSANADRIGPSP